ncbi:MAG TPA: hypothetical protein VE569_06090 [Acidimicrobiia bacterium]|nr:hypothetical protein [Acidimicrobiia bacterium]
MADFDPVSMLRILRSRDVAFVIVGGVAARLRGAPLLTQDVDITPEPTAVNMGRLAAALEDMEARLRSASEPEGVKFNFDAELLAARQLWTLTTKYGDLDLVLEPAGFEGFEELAASASPMRVAIQPDLYVEVAALSDVIASMEAAGREKDLAALPLLRTTLREST